MCMCGCGCVPVGSLPAKKVHNVLLIIHVVSVPEIVMLHSGTVQVVVSEQSLSMWSLEE